MKNLYFIFDTGWKNRVLIYLPNVLEPTIAWLEPEMVRVHFLE